MKQGVDFNITESVFDNGILADKVGKLKIYSFENKNLDVEIWNFAKEQCYTLITLVTDASINSKYFQHITSSLDLSAKPLDIWEKISPLKSFFKNRGISTDDFPLLQTWLQDIQTRYSLDKNINSTQVAQLKFKCVKDMIDKYPEWSIVSLDNNYHPLGFSTATLNDQNLVLDTIYIDPAYRKYPVAVDLVRNQIEKALQRGIKKVETRIYIENKTSLDFFKKIGLSIGQNKLNYYHMWA